MLYFPFNIAYYCYLILCRNTDVQMQLRKQTKNSITLLTTTCKPRNEEMCKNVQQQIFISQFHHGSIGARTVDTSSP